MDITTDRAPPPQTAPSPTGRQRHRHSIDRHRTVTVTSQSQHSHSTIPDWTAAATSASMSSCACRYATRCADAYAACAACWSLNAEPATPSRCKHQSAPNRKWGHDKEHGIKNAACAGRCSAGKCEENGRNQAQVREYPSRAELNSRKPVRRVAFERFFPLRGRTEEYIDVNLSKFIRGHLDLLHP